ncbi:MAG: OmpA family protein [Bacteroidia bacterium]|jgi:outer membrane protein OmpA-like peptidoglycan-associated protein|tara:strand:- start:5299 stop:7227 length:1929 start_codon:yes stop_codon:yes gene_type:complete
MNEIRKNIGILAIALILFIACGTSQLANGQTELPKKTQSIFNKGLQAQNYQDYDKAIDNFKQVIKRAPGYLDAYDALGDTYQKKGDIKSSIATYKRLLDIKPDHFFALYELGGLYYGMKKLDSAEYYYKSFLGVSKTQDKYTQEAGMTLGNIAFAKKAMANPVNITPINMGPNINTREQEYSPAFAIDEKTMYITRRTGNLSDSRPNEDIFYSKLENEEWSKIRNLGPPINTVENEGAFSVSADGHYIFFTSCSRSGGQGQCDIWLTIDKQGTWSEPLNLQKPINTKYWESQPSIASNGKVLYFTSDRPGGFGGTDIWMARFGEKGWEDPVNLGADINTSKDEQFPFIHSDNTTMYFSSEGHPGMGKSDLFITRLRPDGTWETPHNLGYPINTSGYDWNMIVNRDGSTAYYSSDNIPNGQGGLDIYTFQLPTELQAQRVSYIKGFVTDKATNKPLGANILLTPIDGGISTESYANANDGLFMVPLKADLRYALTIDKKGYLFHSEYFDMPNVPSDKPFEMQIELQKLQVGKSVVLNNLFFDTDKYELKPASKTELEKLKSFLDQNPEITVEIGGHTDNVGSSSHNQLLSENRAKAVYTYLVNEGIVSSRLTFKGYGDTAPIASNTKDAGKAKNRRTEFKVIK